MLSNAADSRSGAMVFVCHCLLNANAKVCGLAKYSGVHPRFIQPLIDAGVGIVQLPCPEFLHMGPNRWWQTRTQYDVPAYWRLCRKLASDTAESIQVYSQSGYQVLGILGVEGSPSCGVSEIYDSTLWGGRPNEVDLKQSRVKGIGIFLEAMRDALEERSLALPFYGDLTNMQLPLSASAD